MTFLTSVMALFGHHGTLRTGRPQGTGRRSAAASAQTTGLTAGGLPPPRRHSGLRGAEDRSNPVTSVSRPVKSNPVTDAERLAAEQSAESLADDLGLPVNADVAAVVSTIGRADRVVGDFHCATPLLIEGRVEGRVFAVEHGVRIGRHARVDADIVAAVVTVRGVVTGRVTAARRVRITSSGRVEGIVSAPEVVVEDGGWLLGSVDPERTEPTISVARHRLR